MPKSADETQVRFLKFKKDLEDRLQQWLADHPDSAWSPMAEPRLLPAAPISDQPLTLNKEMTGPGLRVSVLPSTYLDGGWVVWLNGEIRTSFYGPDAHSKATRYAVGLTDGTIDPSKDDSELET